MELLLGVLALLVLVGFGTAWQIEQRRRAAVAELAGHDEVVARMTEAAIVTDRRAARARRELDHLAWVTAVDARAPTASARDHIATLRRTRAEFLEQRERHLLDSALADLELGLRLLDEVGAWVRSHGRPTTTTDVSLREVLDVALDELDHDGKATIDVDPMPDVNVDVDLCARALHEVLDNCVRYRWPDAPVHVTISADTDDAGQVVVRIADDGLGVDLEDTERLFLPFVRGDGAAAMPGVGLGLAKARHAVEACGGTIAFGEHEGQRGATVVLRLPPAQG